jgi:hypothetical protein
MPQAAAPCRHAPRCLSACQSASSSRVLRRCCLPRDGFMRHGTTSIEVCPLCRAETQEVSTRQSRATFCVLAGRSLYFPGCRAIQRVALHKNSREILAMSRIKSPIPFHRKFGLFLLHITTREHGAVQRDGYLRIAHQNWFQPSKIGATDLWKR